MNTSAISCLSCLFLPALPSGVDGCRVFFGVLGSWSGCLRCSVFFLRFLIAYLFLGHLACVTLCLSAFGVVVRVCISRRSGSSWSLFVIMLYWVALSAWLMLCCKWHFHVRRRVSPSLRDWSSLLLECLVNAHRVFTRVDVVITASALFSFSLNVGFVDSCG